VEEEDILNLEFHPEGVIEGILLALFQLIAITQMIITDKLSEFLWVHLVVNEVLQVDMVIIHHRFIP